MEKVLPKGWVETQLGIVCEIVTGNTPPKSNPDYYGDDVLWVKPGDFHGQKLIRQTEEKLSFLGYEKARKVPHGSVLVTCIGNLGNVSIASEDLATNQQINSIVVAHNKLSKKYIYYHTLTIKKWLIANSTSTTISMVNKSVFETAPIIFPPLAEQERIVAKLDKLFAQHEKIKQALDRIPQLLKSFRQQVLTQAVTGKLTEQWREGKVLEEWIPVFKKASIKRVLDDKSQDYILPGIPDSWKWTTIMEISDVKGGKRLPKGDKLVNYNTGFPYIKAGDIKSGVVNADNLGYLKEDTRQKIKSYIVSSGDILITNVGACIGDIGIVPNELDNANQTENALKLCNFQEVNNVYLSYWLRSPIAQTYINQTVLSAGLGKLALGRVQVFPVPFTNLQEQQEIVHRVESLFAKADAIETRYHKLKLKVDKLPQAILHKAFKGELVPQHPTDGDAKDLLHEILALKKEPKGKKK